MKTVKRWFSEIHISNVVYLFTIGSLCFALGEQHHQYSEVANKVDELSTQVTSMHDMLTIAMTKLSYLGPHANNDWR